SRIIIGVANTIGMPGTKCPTVRSAGTIRLRSALMPILMTSRASMEFRNVRHSGQAAARGLIRNLGVVARDPGFADCAPRDDALHHFFAAAARSTKVLPPFILWASGASLV